MGGAELTKRHHQPAGGSVSSEAVVHNGAKINSKSVCNPHTSDSEIVQKASVLTIPDGLPCQLC